MIRYVLATLFLSLLALAGRADPVDQLKAFPALLKLYQAYPTYRAGLSRYAVSQGFKRPVESVATVIHETIHIDSVVHEGYFVDGIYYEPYLRKDAWPGLTNSQVLPYLQPDERGVIYSLYALNTPNNHLGNLIDEINAYGHVMPFICRYEPESKEKQIENLIGFLHLTEGYLRLLRGALSAEYSRFASQREARGAFELIVQRSWKALRDCGVSETSIPSREASYFMSRAK